MEANAQISASWASLSGPSFDGTQESLWAGWLIKGRSEVLMSGTLWPLPWKRRNHPILGEMLLVSSLEIKSSYDDQQGLMLSSSNWPLHLSLPWFIPTNLLVDPQGFCTAVPSAWSALLPSHQRACSPTSFMVLLKCRLVKGDFPDYHLAQVIPNMGIFFCSIFSLWHLYLLHSVYLFVFCLPTTTRMWAPWGQDVIWLKVVSHSLE